MFDQRQFEDGYITAEDENVPVSKEQAYADKVLIRTHDHWNKRITKLKQKQIDLENRIEQKALLI